MGQEALAFRIRHLVVPASIAEHYNSSDQSIFRPHNAYYVLPTPYPYPYSVADQIVEEARRRTRQYKGLDDLDTSVFPKWSPLYTLHQITHAAEHLVIASYYDEGFKTSAEITLAETIFDSKLPRDRRIGILFDQRLGSIDTLDTHVQKVSDQIADYLGNN